MFCAKPIKWEADAQRPEWCDASGYGFYIEVLEDDRLDDCATPYRAIWGEGEPEDFATLEEAQAWCQRQIDEWVRSAVQFEPRFTGLVRIGREQERQQEVEGWTPEHDDEHDGGQLAAAAACYALPAGTRVIHSIAHVPLDWPWSPQWWKPGDRIRELEKAGALIAAEIDRVLRIRANRGEDHVHS